MAYTEFHVDPDSGSNLNAGSTSGAAVYSATGGGWNKDSGTNEGTFTPASGDPSATVSAGMFGALYADGGAAGIPDCIMRVKSVTSTTIVFDQAVFSGTIPEDGSGYTVKVGGAWKGPNGAVGFPFNYLTAALVNTSGHIARVNFKQSASRGANGYDTQVSAAITQTQNLQVVWQGYASSPGDTGRFIIDAGGGSFDILTISGTWNRLINIGVQNNNAAGDWDGINMTGGYSQMFRCSAKTVGGSGINGIRAIECAAADFNKSNTSGRYGLSAAHMIRCIAHDASGSNSSGIGFTGNGIAISCVVDSVGGYGFTVLYGMVVSCDAYNTGNHGFLFGNVAGRHSHAENCNAINNGNSATIYGYSLEASSSGQLINCGHYNVNGQPRSQTTPSNWEDIDPINYDALPWSGAADGDFDITLAAAQNAGRGAYLLDLYASPPTFESHNDVGAARHADPAGAGGPPRNRGILTGGSL